MTPGYDSKAKTSVEDPPTLGNRIVRIAEDRNVEIPAIVTPADTEWHDRVVDCQNGKDITDTTET